MDETQKRKVSAKEFLEQNKKVGFIVATIFTSLLIIYITFVVFYGRLASSTEIGETPVTDSLEPSFTERLFPIFGESEDTKTEYDENGLPVIKNSSSTAVETIINDDSSEVNSRLIKLENEPVSAYTIFDKSLSIKNYIKNKPKICDQKIEVAIKKDEKSPAVKLFQNTLRSMEGFENTPETETLDEATREQIYIFQKRYSDIIYKTKTDKEPTRNIDKETAHFINLLCGFDKELPTDYILIPTLRYVLKENRQTIDYNLLTKEKTNIETKLATGTEEVLLSLDGEYGIFRSENNGEIISELVNYKTKSKINLEKNIKTLSFSSTNKLVYGINGPQGMIIKIYDPKNNEVRKLAEIPLNQWTLFWQTESLIGLFNKPSALATGIFMLLDTVSGKLKQVTSPQYGLAAQATNVANLNILSTSNGNNLKTLLVNNQTKTIGDFGIQTFAEKCSKDIMFDGVFCGVPKTINFNSSLPDDWYKGKIQTEDVIIFKTVSGTTTKVISNLENKPISVLDLKVNKNGIFFIDENTLSLYSLES